MTMTFGTSKKVGRLNLSGETVLNVPSIQFRINENVLEFRTLRLGSSSVLVDKEIPYISEVEVEDYTEWVPVPVVKHESES